MKNTDIESFLRELKIQENDVGTDFYLDLDGDYLYPDYDPIEFSENVIGQGCIQKRKKEIYDASEWWKEF